jgi:hypothetical protein
MAEREEPHFTVEEANALLPALRESLLRIRQARQVILEGGERIRRNAPTNGGGQEGKEYWEALATLRREVESLIEQGIVLRDPESGLIDFPSRLEGEEVVLCWRLDEPIVGHWHTPGSGFGGRKPL